MRLFCLRMGRVSSRGDERRTERLFSEMTRSKRSSATWGSTVQIESALGARVSGWVGAFQKSSFGCQRQAALVR